MMSRVANTARVVRRNFSSVATDAASNSKGFLIAFGLGAAVAGVGAAAMPQAHADENLVPAPAWPWSHRGINKSYDTASIRRGYQVYKEVCSSCHSLNRIAFRELVNMGYTDKEVKVIAAGVEIKDGYTETGEDFVRPGKPSDFHPAPYRNDAEARSANNGALPPDLSLIVKARPQHEDYIFSLLTGYKEKPPAGVTIREGLYYNPYFNGGAIGMIPPLEDGKIEYPDGTPATLSQMAKDVTTFLAFAAAPEQDDRKKAGLKVMTGLTIAIACYWYWKTFKFNVLKNRRIIFKNK